MNIFNKIIGIGFQHAKTSQEKRATKIINIISFILIFICVFFLVLHLFVHQAAVERIYPILIAMMIIGGISLALNHFGKLLISKILFVLITSSSTFYIAASSGLESLNMLSLLVQIPVAALLFTNREKFWRTIFFILPFIFFGISEYTDYHLFGTFEVPEEELKQGRWITMLTNMLILVAIIRAFTADTEKNEKALQENVAELQKTRASLEVQQELAASQEELQTSNEELRASEEELKQNLEELQTTQDNLIKAQIEQQKFVSLVENVNAFIGITDLQGNTQYLNKAGQHMSGFGKNYKGVSIADFHNKEGAIHAVEVIVPNVMQTGKWTGENKLYNRNTKELHTTLANVFLINDPTTKEPIGIATVQTDITKQKKLEKSIQEQNKKLQASEEELQQNLEELQSTNDQIQVIQKEVEQKELNLRSLIDNTDDGIYSMDKNYCFVTTNQKVIDQYAAGGVKIEKGMSVIDLAPTEKIRNDFKELYDVALIKGERITIEYDYSDKSVGIVAFYELHINPIIDNQKQIIGCSVFARDITERKQKEEQNQLLRKLIDNTSDAVQVATTEGQFIYMNTVGLNRLGLQGEDINNYTTADIESVFKEEGVWQGHVEEVKAVDVFILQSINTDKSTGREFPVEVSIKYTEINDKGFMVAVSRDVTEQQNREKEIQNKNKALQASEEELQQNLEELQSTQELLEKQKEGVEKSYQELQATQKQLIQSEKMASLGQLIANIAHEINTPLGAISSSSDSIEVVLLETFPTLPAFIKKLDEQTLPIFNKFVQSTTNKTDTLSSREKRNIKYDLIEELESNNIPTSEDYADLIVDMNLYDEKELFMNLLQSNRSEEFKREMFAVSFQLSTIVKSNNTIKEATKRAAKTVFALKNFARQDQTEEKSEVNLNETIETTLTLYQNQIKQGIDVIRNFEEIPLFLGYPDELMQVWTNLIHNAIQAMKTKGQLLIATKIQESKDKNTVLVSIQDNGGGIPKEVQDKIFDAFFTTKIAGEGSGLGLDITKKIIEKHEGKIWFESEEGIGTTFFVELPLMLN